MNAPGEDQDARASGAKPRPEGRVCEQGRRPTLVPIVRLDHARRAHRRARPGAIARRRQLDACTGVDNAEAAV